MISEIMTDPFGTNYPPTLLAAAELLRTIMRCCWPRITDYSNEIIRTLTVCFLNVEDEDNFPGGKTSQEELRSALTQTAEVLSAILDVNDISLSDTISPLIETEPLLSSLFITKKSHLGVART